jgi:hypothetical protein
MRPSIELRLTSMLKAMREVIAPAIEAGNDLAQEQAQLMIAQLTLIARQWDQAARYETLCHHALIALARTLSTEARGGEHTLHAAAALTEAIKQHALDAIPSPDKKTLDEARIAISAAIDALVQASMIDSNPDFHAASANAILEHAELQTWRDRVWFAEAGLDPERATLPTLEEMLAAGSRILE